MDIKDKNVTVLGLGLYPKGSGMGAAKWLLRHGAFVTITDQKPMDELQDQVYKLKQYKEAVHPPVFVLGEHRDGDIAGADMVVQNPGVSFDHPLLVLARKHNIPVESDISLFVERCPFPVIAVTGTRGKSTTTVLLWKMLQALSPQAVMAGNIQHSPLEELDWLLKEEESVPIVLELSSWLIESLAHTKWSPQIAVFTNIYEDHLNRYATFDAYAQAKEALFLKQRRDQHAVLNSEQPRMKKIRTKANKHWFSGQYMEANVNAARLAARIAGVEEKAIEYAVSRFKGLSDRQEIVVQKGGVTFVNDTTATSPEGVLAALHRFDKDIVLICGGSSKRLSYEQMGQKVRETCRFVVYLQGSATQDIAAAIGEGVPHALADSMDAAVQAAAKQARPRDIVLLSPGAASFGMFKNEFDRGQQFRQAVAHL